jgi:anti-anti-sigma regulatory factor
MLRIAITATGDTTIVLKLEGKLLEPWIDELRRSITVSPEHLTLDLSSLSYADAAGVQVLAALVRKGATLQGPSGFISALLNSEPS